MSSQKITLNQKIVELDGIRGLAISMVYLYHCVPLITLPGFGLRSPTDSLWFGVDLFFVLSGFLITRILIATRDRPHKYRTFFAKRVLRIFPLYMFALTLLFYVLGQNDSVAKALAGIASKGWYYTYTFNIQLTLNNSWPQSHYLNHFWSLCIEEQFYLFWPLIVFNSKRRHLPRWFAMIIIGSMGARVALYVSDATWVSIYTNTLTRMDALAMGGLAAYAHHFWRREQVLPVARMLLLAAGIILLVSGVINRGLPITAMYTHMVCTQLLAVFFGAFIYLVLNDSGGFDYVRRVLRSKILGILGKYSYGIYVYHWLVWMTVIRANVFQLQLSSLGLLQLYLLVAVITALCTVVSYHVIETPLLRLKRKL